MWLPAEKSVILWFLRVKIEPAMKRLIKPRGIIIYKYLYHEYLWICWTNHHSLIRTANLTFSNQNSIRAQLKRNENFDMQQKRLKIIEALIIKTKTKKEHLIMSTTDIGHGNCKYVDLSHDFQ